MDDDADDDASPLGPPLHPDDRLWRHPSEVVWTPGGASGDVSGGVPARPKTNRVWPLAMVSGLTGAVLTLGVVVIVGGLNRPVVERTVERVPFRQVALAPGGNDLAAVAAAVMPSVVRLEIDGAAGMVIGSGVVYRSDGIVVTNAHVVDGADAVTIVLNDGVGLPGRVVGSDPLTDIAIVAVDDDHRGATTWLPAVLGSADDLAVGQVAIAIGSPLGLAGEPSVTQGIVSALGRRVVAMDGSSLHDMIQTDASIAEGSSGGALVDASGVVIGITTAVSGDGSGVGFATPIDVVRTVCEQLLGSGEATHAWLGIEGADLERTMASLLGTPGGVQVNDVVPGSPADAAGLRSGDVLLAVDDQRLSSMSDLVLALRGYRPGDVVTLELRRAALSVTVEATLTER